MKTATPKVEELKSLNAYQLADIAECGVPTNQNNDGAEYLNDIRDDILNAYIENTLDDYPHDTLNEIIDSNMPIYTGQFWRVFTDLEAYNEDASDFGYDGADMTRLATGCLWVIGHRLGSYIIEQLELEV